MQDWIRGVNIGGWLVLERFITPYLFAITDCHVTGNFCYYPGQIDAPPHSNEKYCDLFRCKPHRFPSATGATDYPTDEYTLMQSFATPDIARKYLDQHYENFVTQDDVKTLHEHGVTHVRVPLGHWILGTDEENAPFVTAHGWLYLVRFVGWCREYKIQVWPDLHTAPGSQNGFDNSGHLLPGKPTCHNWSSNQTLVQNTLNKLLRIATQIRDDGLTDVITGIGILNEPFVDCNRTVIRDYSIKALQGIRSILGPDTSVYLGDMFNATKWNDGWWLNETNTFLDSHYYHGKHLHALSSNNKMVLWLHPN
jgi:glucan 1,3-beta-glucosidase